MKTALYRHYDADDLLLYVGISLSAISRLKQHSKSAHWSDKIRRVEVEYFDTRKEAEEAETLAIRREKPLHNIAKNGAVRPPSGLKIANDENDVPILLFNDPCGSGHVKFWADAEFEVVNEFDDDGPIRHSDDLHDLREKAHQWFVSHGYAEPDQYWEANLGDYLKRVKGKKGPMLLSGTPLMQALLRGHVLPEEASA